VKPVFIDDAFVAVIAVAISPFIGHLAIPVHANNIGIATPTPTGTPAPESSNQNKSASPVQQKDFAIQLILAISYGLLFIMAR
jgi:hypothetical protein